MYHLVELVTPFHVTKVRGVCKLCVWALSWYFLNCSAICILVLLFAGASLNCLTFCNRTWYGYCDGAPSGVGVSCKKVGSLFSSMKLQQGLVSSDVCRIKKTIKNNNCFYSVFQTIMISLKPNFSHSLEAHFNQASGTSKYLFCLQNFVLKEKKQNVRGIWIALPWAQFHVKEVCLKWVSYMIVWFCH